MYAFRASATRCRTLTLLRGGLWELAKVVLRHRRPVLHRRVRAREFGGSDGSPIQNYTVWFVSSDSFENIGQFAKDYDLVDYANVHFVRTEVMEVINNFGAIATPSVYIYSDERQLIKAINGETRIEEIIKYL